MRGCVFPFCTVTFAVRLTVMYPCYAISDIVIEKAVTFQKSSQKVVTSLQTVVYMLLS